MLESLSGVSDGTQHRMFIINIVIIDNFPVNCIFSATLNLTFVPTRIVMRSLNLGFKPSIPPYTILHAPLLFSSLKVKN
jgi:hypothetical protein